MLGNRVFAYLSPSEVASRRTYSSPVLFELSVDSSGHNVARGERSPLESYFSMNLSPSILRKRRLATSASDIRKDFA